MITLFSKVDAWFRRNPVFYGYLKLFSRSSGINTLVSTHAGYATITIGVDFHHLLITVLLDSQLVLLFCRLKTPLLWEGVALKINTLVGLTSYV